MREYKITDEVEMGYLSTSSDNLGGTVQISISFGRYSPDRYQEILDIIDHLDHTLVTDNKYAIKYSERYFLLEKSQNIFHDILSILYSFIRVPLKCTISINKETYTDELREYSPISKYSIKG